jgi:hypothetical protein
MTFGRPPLLPLSHKVPRPLPLDDEFLRSDGEGVQPREVPSRMSMFVSSSILFDILYKVLCRLYFNEAYPNSQRQGLESTIVVMLPDIMDLNRELDQFSMSIPDYLRWQENSACPQVYSQNGHVTLQQHVLQCRFVSL